MDIKLNRVYNDDVFKVIESIDNNALDLVLTDPPYGDDSGYGRKGKTILNNEDESINYRFIDAIYQKMKINSSMYIFTNHKFVHRLINYIDHNSQFSYKMTCVIVKNNIGMGNPFRNQYELCIVVEKGDPTYNLKSMSNVWKMKHVRHDDKSHPHQKDWDIMRRIILHSSSPGDLVFDGFMGSFTTALACYKENRSFIGAELDKHWFDSGQRRLQELMNQKTLF